MSEDNSKEFSVYKKNGIMYCICPTGIVTLENITNAIKRRIELAEGKAHPIFIDARTVKYWTLESRRYGFSKAAHQCANSYGVVINYHIQEVLLNWAIKMFPTTIPQKMFTNEQEAIKWLQKYVDKEQD